ncbi:hypothetical protein MOF23_07750 [Bacillus inaquosorum]|uniref:hypothetical protein n=1 Tax=Bacillus inaquosorum TaxID=483913 RepID=UPI002280D000|nr:hypothetical protein [Bacillus inaquosorum]MCY9308863.1 hypothetical protein [Bacillus inaquosorum]
MKNAVERFDWWGVTLTGKYKTVKTLYQLMDINKKLFENLYKVQANTIKELVNKLYEQVPDYEKKFLKYVNEQLPILKRSLQFELPSSPQLIASIEYEIYISSAEVDCKYPFDARGCIIDFFKQVPEMINLYKEESASSSILNDITGGYTVKRGSI